MKNQPKPFIFVLMPFDDVLSDTYKFGIKGAAEDAGAYAERLDEQIFNEGMLDRIFNQINKADVVVADMTGRNPNVFYEVGYAHALGKNVILLTQSADDIPFDLQHQQHLVYDGSISKLKEMLSSKIKWALEQERTDNKPSEFLSLRVFDVEVPANGDGEIPYIDGSIPSDEEYFTLPVYLRNESSKPVTPITHAYLFLEANSEVVPANYTTQQIISNAGSPHSKETKKVVPHQLQSFDAMAFENDDLLSRQVRIPISFDALPPGAIEERNIGLMFRENSQDMNKRRFKLRVHTQDNAFQYTFDLRIHATTGR
ncbi:nucleoside 2-deoxyribosyltransferase [Agarivorans litoreus]|uniref:nucleoside 2-deoxyribosyltransferase n=1 Tax=Agarivorans litoreus TaxID=1510455 RepID=UPI001C7D4FF6|nr:nucleoside 2-deoxyribosyltransferase [Agarivorans litoreus]